MYNVHISENERWKEFCKEKYHLVFWMMQNIIKFIWFIVLNMDFVVAATKVAKVTFSGLQGDWQSYQKYVEKHWQQKVPTK